MARTSGRASTSSLRRVLVIIALLVAGVLALPAVGAAQSEPTFDVELRVENDRVVLVLTDSENVIEWIQGAILFDQSELGTATCDVIGAAGACNDNGGSVDFAAIAPGGLDLGVELVEVSFPRGSLTETTEFEVGPTIGGPDGVTLEARPTIVRQFTSASELPMVLVWTALGLVAVGVVAGVMLRRRSSAG